MSIDYDPLSAEHGSDPYPIYRRLRDEAPLHRGPKTDVLCLSRHADVAFALRHPELFTSSTMEKFLMGSEQKKLKFRDIPGLAQSPGLWLRRPSLARLEAKVALEALIPELPRERRDPTTTFVDSFIVRGPRSLELEARI